MSLFLLDISLKTKGENTDNNTFSLDYNTSTKFKNDKVHFQDENYVLVIDGVILNKAQIHKANTQKNWASFLIDSFEKKGDHFFKALKGSYYGFLYDKKQNKWIIFSDHINSKPIYFAEYENSVCFSNDYAELLQRLKQKGVSLTLNEQAAYLLLTYGFVMEDITITNEIKRILVGYCVLIDNNRIRHEKFYSVTNKPVAISEEDAIEEIDRRFRKAVALAFEKDKEYNYKHIAALSGGLDSRMTVWVAHSLGYIDQLNLTFSQSDYLDETVAKQIASDLKHEWLFKALDNGNFLTDIRDTTKLTGGNVLYYGLAHGMSLYKYINFDNLGILHSGQLGDVVISTFYSGLDPEKMYTLGDGAYSKQLLSRIEDLSFKENYPNEELFKLYIRGFYGANYGLKCSMQFTETYSPFYDIDFLEFALSIPVDLRLHHRLYKKWINKKYPKAAEYIWEKENVAVNYPYLIPFKGKKIPLNQFPVKIASRLGIKKQGSSTKNHMNPLEYWYQTNPELKTFMDNYYNAHIDLLDKYPQLKNDCEKLYFTGKETEKVQVLSLLAGIVEIIS